MNYASFKKAVYLDRKKQNIEYPKIFVILGCYYSKDEKNLYYKDVKLNRADMNSFMVLYWEYAKDKSRIYFNYCVTSEESDSFEIL